MAQFDIHRNRAGTYPQYLMVLSHEIVETLPTVVVAPLVPLGELGNRPMSRLLPAFEIDGVQHALLSIELAGVSRTVLGDPVMSAADRRYDILGALDFLFTGI